MRVYKNSIIIVLIMCVTFTIALYMNIYNLDIMSLFVISFLPIIFSFIISFVITKKMNLGKTNPFLNALIFSFGNLYCAFIEWFLLNRNDGVVEKILQSSQKYTSEYVQITKNSNPMMSVIILFVFSLVINFIIFNNCVRRIEQGNEQVSN